MKLIFKIAFPNRVWLFLSELLMLLPFLYPEFYEMVGKKFLAVQGVEIIFVLLNRPLIVGVVLLALTLVLALVTPKYERRKKMNMFLLHRTEQTDEQEDEPVEE
jgi:membrane protein implicated in regulation of membrane protease activity